MAANKEPIFVLNPIIATCELAAANTARDGSGANLITLFTAGADGARCDRIEFISAQALVAANSLMVCRVFISDPTGSNFRLLREVQLTAVTASNTVIGSTVGINFIPALGLRAGQVIKVSQSVYAGVQDKVHVTGIFGDF